MRDDPSDPRPADMPPAKVDMPRIERAVREILLAVGENPDREGLLKTPNRVARSYAELFAGLRTDPRGLGASERHAATCLSLPCHPQLADDEVAQVIEAVNSF